MKRRFFSTVLFIVLCLFALNLKGDITWQKDPMITSFPLEFNKYIDIVSGKVSWYHGDTASVYVSAELKGVGYGIATLKNVYLMGEPNVQIYGGYKDYVGTKDENGPGSWTSGTGSVSVGRKVKIPDKAGDGDSWSWGAGGGSEITPTQYEWHETVSWGVNIQIPKGISGRYTTTGGWANGTLSPRTAPARSGTHTLKVKYICRQCNASGKTAAEIGGKSAHEKITCPAPNCSVQYHKCSPPSNHAVCSACGDRKCDGDDHSYVKRCTGKWFHGPSNEPSVKLSGCGQSIHKCTESDHNIITLDCGHPVLACVRDSHTCPVTDDTPNCQDCTSHCSSPCSCTNSGTCNGTVTDNTPNCSGCTSHCSSPCSCTNSGTCNGTVAAPPPPPEPEPSEPRCANGHTYDPNNTYQNNLHRTRTCRYTECGRTWEKCTTPITPVCRKPYRQRNGLKCWAINP